MKKEITFVGVFLLLGIMVFIFEPESAIATTPEGVASEQLAEMGAIKPLILDYMQKNAPDTRSLSSGDARETLYKAVDSGEYYVKNWFERDKGKYVFYAKEDAWWLGFDITELHSSHLKPHLLPPQTLTQEIFNFRMKLRYFLGLYRGMDIREALTGMAKYHFTSRFAKARHKIFGTESLDNPPLSDDLGGLYKYDDNVVWMRIK